MVFGYFEGSEVSQVHAEETVSLKLKTATAQSNGTTGKDTIQLHELVKSVVQPCYLSPVLFNGHLQTSMATGDTPVHYRRHIFESDHEVFPGQFTVDFVYHPETPPPRDKTLPPRTHNFTDAEWQEYTSNTADEAPMLITMHGLSGGSHEEYVRHTLLPLTKEGTGWTACVINARGCAWSKLTTPVLFNARATWDMRQLVKFLREKFPKKKLFAVGYSLGANILTNYLGEESDKCELSAAIIVGNPWDLGSSNGILKGTWVGLNIYHAAMGGAVKRLFFRHKDILSKNPNLDLEKIASAKYLYEWDRYVQCPSWGYPTENAYYRDASSVDLANRVKIPTLALHAKDDPIISDIVVPYEMFNINPFWTMVATANGGHLGWFEYGGGRWSSKTIVAFLHKFMAETEGMVSIEKAPKIQAAVARQTDGMGQPSNWDPMSRTREYVKSW